MIWLAEWKKYLVYEGVHHHIILDGVDSQGQQAFVDFKIFEPDLYTQFFNNEIIKSQKEKEELIIRGQIILEWPWFIAYWSRKHLTVDQFIAEGAKRCDIPSKTELILCLETLNLVPRGSGDLPYPTIDLARSAVQLTERLSIETAAANGDQNAIEVLEDSTRFEYVLAQKRKKVNNMDVSVIIKKIANLRLLLNRQNKNDAELEADIQGIVIELEDPPDKKDWSKYLSAKLGFQRPA